MARRGSAIQVVSSLVCATLADFLSVGKGQGSVRSDAGSAFFTRLCGLLAFLPSGAGLSDWQTSGERIRSNRRPPQAVRVLGHATPSASEGGPSSGPCHRKRNGAGTLRITRLHLCRRILERSPCDHASADHEIQPSRLDSRSGRSGGTGSTHLALPCRLDPSGTQRRRRGASILGGREHPASPSTATSTTRHAGAAGGKRNSQASAGTGRNPPTVSRRPK